MKNLSRTPRLRLALRGERGAFGTSHLWMALALFAVAMLAAGCASRHSFPGEVPKSQMDPLSILPVPKSVEPRAGAFRIADGTPIILAEGAERPERLAAERFAQWCRDERGVAPVIGSGSGPAIVLETRAGSVGSGPEMEGYTLDISPDEIRVTGNSAAGLYYGIVTLAQIARNSPGAQLPAGRIVDAPDFAFRGFYHDATRGKVPKLETMKRIADFLADNKANQMQLYVEHTFAFSFAPDIPHNPDGLTAAEIRELDAYCGDRRIDLVPSLQSFGHMAGVLSLPRYRHFAEIEMEPWETLEWHPKMKGATIDTSNPEALALLKRMLDEFLPLFDSPYMNVCADETYDLGEGKTKPIVDRMSEELAGQMDPEKARQMAKGRLYLRHIGWLNEVVKSHGKRMMFWGDIVKKHPALIPEIPKDAILLNWGYSYKTDFESCKLFKDAGLDFYVCPGTSGWNEILNRMDNADENIRKYVAAGREYGAIGVLNTDWGDHGHYNLLAGSWHGAALGAALAWNGDDTDQATFDRLWAREMFGVETPEIANTLRSLAFDREHYGSWIMFYRPLANVEAVEKLDDAEAEALKLESAKAVKLLEKLHRENAGDPQDTAELVQMARMMGMLGEKALLARAIAANGGARNPALAERLERFADDTEKLYIEYESLWRARNKESDLAEIRERIVELIDEARTAARGIEG